MRSTLVNLDLEEVCRCLSRAVMNHIQNQPVLGSRLLELRHRMAEMFNEEIALPDEVGVYNYVKILL